MNWAVLLKSLRGVVGVRGLCSPEKSGLSSLFASRLLHVCDPTGFTPEKYSPLHTTHPHHSHQSLAEDVGSEHLKRRANLVVFYILFAATSCSVVAWQSPACSKEIV